MPDDAHFRGVRRVTVSSGSASTLAPASASPPRKGRRRITGRTHQINVKTTGAAIEPHYRLADEMGAPLGEVLEQALEKARK